MVIPCQNLIVQPPIHHPYPRLPTRTLRPSDRHPHLPPHPLPAPALAPAPAPAHTTTLHPPTLQEIDPSYSWVQPVLAGVGLADDPVPLHRDMHAFLKGGSLAGLGCRAACEGMTAQRAMQCGTAAWKAVRYRPNTHICRVCRALTPSSVATHTPNPCPTSHSFPTRLG